MTTRAAALRTLFEHHLSLFATEHRAALVELLRLASIGERALALLDPAANSTPAKATASSSLSAQGSRAATPPKTAAPKMRSRKKADGSPSLRDVIRAVLKDANKPLSLAEIEAAVKAQGYASTSAKFSKVVALNIAKMKSELRRVDRGVYTLT